MPAGGGALQLQGSDGVCVLWRTSGVCEQRYNQAFLAHVPPRVHAHTRSLASPRWTSDSPTGPESWSCPAHSRALCPGRGPWGAPGRPIPGSLVLRGHDFRPHPLSARLCVTILQARCTPPATGVPESYLCPPSHSRLSPPCPLLLQCGGNGRGRGGSLVLSAHHVEPSFFVLNYLRSL